MYFKGNFFICCSPKSSCVKACVISRPLSVLKLKQITTSSGLIVAKALLFSSTQTNGFKNSSVSPASYFCLIVAKTSLVFSPIPFTIKS